jgi:hypothetical protein
MDQSPAWEADSPPVGQVIPYLPATEPGSQVHTLKTIL